MVIRFKDNGNLRDAVNDSYERALPENTAMLKEHIYLLDNGDLHIDDDFDTELSGIFLKAMRVHHFLEEDAEIVVPWK